MAASHETHDDSPADVPRSHEPRDVPETTARLLARAAQTKNPATRRRLQDEVIVLNMNVARAIAGRYRNKGVAYDDLVQVANMGLVKAARSFDARTGAPFLAYATPTISGEIKRHFRDRGWWVRPPRRVQELQQQISRAAPQLTQTLERSPKPTELARFLDVDRDQVVEALAADGCFAPASLDFHRAGDDAPSPLDLLGASDADLSRVDARLSLAPILREFSERNRRILMLRFYDGWTQERIAQEVGVTQMQVSRILSQMLRQIRARLD